MVLRDIQAYDSRYRYCSRYRIWMQAWIEISSNSIASNRRWQILCLEVHVH